jgi:hypothetical protein
MAAKKAVETRTIEEAMAAKAAEEAVVMKVTVDKAMAVKVAEEGMVKMAVDEAAMKIADQGVAGAKATVESTGFDSSRAPMVGTKRAAMPGGSTPPSKRFHHAWKPWYAWQLCSHLLLFFYLY